MDVFLRNKNYRKFSIAGFLSSAGNILFYLAFMTYASKLQNYALALSLISITEAIPDLLGSVAGYIADRTQNKFKMITWLAVIRFILYMLVGFLFTRNNIAGWNLVLIVIAINFISDLSGSYSGGLETPIIVNLVSEEEVAEAEGFTGGVSSILQMLAQFAGSGLLLFMSYSGLAVVNALTFLIAGLIFANVGHNYYKVHSEATQEAVNNQNFFKTMINSFKQLKKEKGIFTILITIALLNGVLGALEPLISIMIAANKTTMIIGTFSFTIALFGAIGSIGAAIGSILGTKLFKSTSLLIIALIDTIFSAGMVITIFSKNIILCMFMFFFLAFFAGTASPKLEQWIVTSVDRTILSSTIGAVNTILIVTSPLVTAVISTISATTSVYYSLGTLLIGSIIVFGVILHIIRKTNLDKQPVEN